MNSPLQFAIAADHISDIVNLRANSNETINFSSGRLCFLNVSHRVKERRTEGAQLYKSNREDRRMMRLDAKEVTSKCYGYKSQFVAVDKPSVHFFFFESLFKSPAVSCLVQTFF